MARASLTNIFPAAAASLFPFQGELDAALLDGHVCITPTSSYAGISTRDLRSIWQRRANHLKATGDPPGAVRLAEALDEYPGSKCRIWVFRGPREPLFALYEGVDPNTVIGCLRLAKDTPFGPLATSESDEPHWQQRWVPAPVGLAKQLAKEIGPRHQLFGIQALLVARCTDCDDVLFHLNGAQDPLAVVHLNWSQTPVPDSGIPTFTLYSTLADWAEDCATQA